MLAKTNKNISQNAILLFVLALAFVIRLWGAPGRALWFDEGASVYFAHFANWEGWASDVHPPLYYIILHYWMLIADSDFALRLLSIIFGTASVLLVYLTGRLLFTQTSSLWSALFFSLHSANIWYSQEVRMYALLIFLYTVAILGFVMVAKTKHKEFGIIAFALGGASMLYVQGLGPLFTATLSFAWLVWLLARKSYFELRLWIFGNVLIVIIFTPWALTYISKINETASPEYGLAHWIASPEWWQLIIESYRQTVLSIPSPAEILKINLPGNLVPIILGKWWWSLPLSIVFVLGSYAAFKRHRDVAVMLFLLFALPFAGAFVASYILQPVFLVRNLLVTSVPLVLLLGLASESTWVSTKFRSLFLLTCALTLAINAFYVHRYGPAYAVNDEGWELVAKSIGKNGESGDILIVGIDSNETPVLLLKRYDENNIIDKMDIRYIYSTPSFCNSRINCLDEIFKGIKSDQRVWVVSAHENAFPDSALVSGWLRDHLNVNSQTKLKAIALTQGSWIR